jgi:acylglycerol lipase
MASTKNQRTSTFHIGNGGQVFYRNWTTDYKPKGVVLIVHGLNAHSGYYQDFAEKLNENEYEVYALDLPGHGRTAGKRFHINAYQDVIAHIHHLLGILRSSHPRTPIFLFGHCAGGLLASIYALDHQFELTGLIAESCFLQFAAGKAMRIMVKTLGNVWPDLELIRLNPGYLSRDPLIVDQIRRDPFLANKKLPLKTLQQLLSAADYLKNAMPGLKLPLLILHGKADKVTLFCGSEYMMTYAASADKQLKLYEGHYHDLLNDKYNGMIKSDIMLWLSERT